MSRITMWGLLAVAACVASCTPWSGDRATGPDSRSVRLALSVRASTAASRTVALSAWYLRPGQSTPVLLGQRTETLTSGTNTLPFSVPLDDCLTDPLGPATEGRCPLHLSVALRDASDVLVDSTSVGPFVAGFGETVNIPEVRLVSAGAITITGADTLRVGQQAPLAAVMRDSSGAIMSGRVVGWQTSNPAVAIVTPAGVVTALAPGSVTITATSGNSSGSVAREVWANVATVAITMPDSLGVGDTVRVTAEARSAQGAVIPARPVAAYRVVSSTAQVAMAGIGVLRFESAGTVTLEATIDGVSTVATRTVLPLATAACRTRRPPLVRSGAMSVSEEWTDTTRVVWIPDSVVVSGAAVLTVGPGMRVCSGAGGGVRLRDQSRLLSSGVRWLAADSSVGWGGLVVGSTAPDTSRITGGSIEAIIANPSAAAVVVGPGLALLSMTDVRVVRPRGTAIAFSVGAQPRLAGGRLTRVTVDSVAAPAPGSPVPLAVNVSSNVIVEDLVVRDPIGPAVLWAPGARPVPTSVRIDGLTITGSANEALTAPIDSLPRSIERVSVQVRSGVPARLSFGFLARMLADDSTSLLRLTGADSVLVDPGSTRGASFGVTAGPALVFVGTIAHTIADGELRAWAGARFVFSEGRGLGINGRLQARGGATTPVIFTARDSAVGWNSLVLGGAGAMELDRVLITQPRGIPAINTFASQTTIVRRTVMRRFNSPAIFAQAKGAIIEDSRFDAPRGGGTFGMVQASTQTGIILEIRRSVFRGAETFANNNPNAHAIRFQTQGGPLFQLPTRLELVDITIDSLGRGITFDNTLQNLASITTIRSVNFSRIGRQSLTWTDTTSVLDARNLWWGTAAGPVAAAASNDSTPNSVWNPALVNYVPVASAPISFPEPPNWTIEQATASARELAAVLRPSAAAKAAPRARP